MLNTLGKYQLRGELGKGAMGIVYEGFDPFIQRTVAIKTVQTALIPHDCLQETLGRFRREAQAAGRLLHPNIITIYEYGEDNGMAFIAMEMVQGMELQEHITPASPQQVVDSLNLMMQLLDALDYSHKNGVIHRDIKPANIMVTREGQIKIADFGIAKVDTAGSDLTQVGTIVGTPIYMSPEQMEGHAVDQRSDLYSAGVLLYQLLTGTRPFSGNSMTEIMHKVMQHVPPLPSSLNRHVSPALDKAVMRAIEKDPARRFQRASEFSLALQAALNTATAAVQEDATLKLDKAEPGAMQKPVIEFDLGAVNAAIEHRLAEQRKAETKIPEAAPAATRITLNLPEASTSFTHAVQTAPIIQTASVIPAPKEDLGSQSSLLQALAQEAASTRNEQESQNQLGQENSQHLHDALSRLHAYLKNFSEHVDAMHPPVPRQYRLDARTQFNDLKWQASKAGVRNENLHGATRATSVSFSITLANSTEVMLARPWNQLEALQRELQMLKLRVLNDNDLNFRLAKHESIQAALYPSLQILLDFSGSYATGSVELNSLNLGQFGSERYRLEAEDITPAMLDELGLFLLGRSNKLPAALKRI